MEKSEFQKILEQKLGLNSSVQETSPLTSAGHFPQADESFWGSLYSQNIQRSTPTYSQTHTCHFLNRFYKKPVSQPAPKEEIKILRPRPEHNLTHEQKKALDYFKDKKIPLPKNFFEEELAEAFRSLALQLHPDLGGQDASFIELHAHYKALKSLFAKAN